MFMDSELTAASLEKGLGISTDPKETKAQCSFFFFVEKRKKPEKMLGMVKRWVENNLDWLLSLLNAFLAS